MEVPVKEPKWFFRSKLGKMKSQMRDTFESMKPKGWLLDDVETEEASGFGKGANFMDKRSRVSQRLIWRMLQQNGLNEEGK